MSKSTLKVRILGSGTSTGVPVIACKCEICSSPEPKNKRLRSSILLTNEKNQNLVIDTTPDFRQQMLSAEVTDLEHVLYTHTHADHCHGFDDLRQFAFQAPKPVQCYSSAEHLADLRARFSYTFENTSYFGLKPQVELNEISSEPFNVLNWKVEPLYLDHGGVRTIAYRFGNFAYATDFKAFTDADIHRWRGKIHTMVASGIRFRPHPSHSSVPETIELFRRLDVQQGIITHISHEVDHNKDSADLPKGMSLAFDGMVVDVPQA